MIPLDATNQVLLTQGEIRPWHQGDSMAAFTAGLYDIMFENYGYDQMEIFDLTAAVIMARPDLCEFQPLHLAVVMDEGNTFGQTAVVSGAEPNIQVCLEPDAEGVKRELNDAFTSASPPADLPPIDPLIGTWAGLVYNNDFEMEIVITIDDTCASGEVFGRFDISTVSCSGTLTWVGMDGELYQFEAGDKTENCGEGVDYLLPQADGTVMYISRGDYGETTGTLQRAP